ncbi:hypothetical protein M0R01_04400 [bacterium]|jgi:hypothetical protein|nr:hypothetical protein [bacterium]
MKILTPQEFIAQEFKAGRYVTGGIAHVGGGSIVDQTLKSLGFSDIIPMHGTYKDQTAMDAQKIWIQPLMSQLNDMNEAMFNKYTAYVQSQIPDFNKLSSTDKASILTGKTEYNPTTMKSAGEGNVNIAGSKENPIGNMTAVYLNGENPIIITGTSIDDISKKASDPNGQYKINPANLYGTGFRDPSTIPTGNNAALKALGISTMGSEKGSDQPISKQVFKSGKDLFYQIKDGYKKIADVPTLESLSKSGVIDTSIGYKDLPAGANIIGNIPTGDTPPYLPGQPESNGNTGDTTPINTGSSVLPTVDIPKELSDNPYFNQLDDNNKAIIAYYWNITNSQDVAKQTEFQNALKLAGEQADPYWKEKLNVLKDETNRALGTLETDEATNEAELSRRSQEITDNLTYNKGYLTTEQQAELAKQKDTYDQDLVALRESMAAKGLSSSSIKTQAGEQLAKSNAGVVESTQRQYAKQLRDLGVNANSSITDITSQINNLKKKLGENKTDIIRKVESYLGSTDTTTNINNSSSYLLGNIKGTIGEEKGTDILQRANALLGSSL